MALGLGYGLPFSVKRPVQSFAEDVALSVNNALADAAQREEAGNCLAARAIDIMQTVQTQPSLLIVPQLYKAGVLYDQLPTTRTNFIPNNSMAGATGSVLPTNWSIASLPAGITLSYSASGTAVAADGTSVNYIDVTVSGTAGASGFLNIRPKPSPSTIAAFIGQSWNTSVYLQLISGSVASISPTWQLQELNSSQVFLQGSNVTGLSSLAVGGPFERYNVSRVFTESTTAYVTCRWGHSFVSGTTYSYTLRIGSPQLERLGVATPMIATSTGAVTRLNESTDVVGLPPDFTVSRNTTATRVNSSGLIQSVASGVPRIDWLGQSCPGLLVEASGQNQALWSRDLSVSGTWAASGITAVRNAVGADGTASGATTLTATAASATITQNISHASQSRIFSAYMRRVSGTGQIQLTTNGGTNWQTVTLTSAFAPFNSGAQTVASGQVGIRMIASGDVIEVDFTQAEVGPIATSPIPTTSGTGSRAADVISASGALVSGLIGQTEGTIYAEVLFSRINANQVISLGSSNDRIQIFFDSSTGIYALIRVGGVTADYNATIPAVPATGGVYKIALAYKANDYCWAVNGVTYNPSTASRGVPANMSAVYLGASVFSSAQLNDRIRAAALYTTRLSNDQLAELTRL